MCTVIIIATVVAASCPGPRPSPAEAARIVAPRQFVYVAPAPAGPTIEIVASAVPQHDAASVTARAIAEADRRRLDGSPWTQPTTVYGIPYPWTPLTWAIGHRHEGGRK
jgi:hypothetical protein